ncbi:hypothetical protein BS50DRAFT_575422 [Corynespora cassiicola Philippines]|uniref:Uncharacterized protein n=1 Tax=Corynespora cassiicola Philippines TaxID=1448308 RepID=A0A2T2NK32_CORCC|nr:hypothetical protein BS50DRAFT_575422 [Corynespora cassiicola Philippines]
MQRKHPTRYKLHSNTSWMVVGRIRVVFLLPRRLALVPSYKVPADSSNRSLRNVTSVEKIGTGEWTQGLELTLMTVLLSVVLGLTFRAHNPP